ncbi:hypothetical protein NG895_13875 [Aeoliella sp. ICT_H6.2]|uniref:Secreted protein with PEP-CTERM sorting signal n=1 Tax=Aeoliella straminimaris TaxID=2954799 RepID=A0A9X2FAK4_9BACT|nr:hypothetical protein [Aeoliella straminimaris]MCO6044994.1 hypothetical protein [Aeoliella straminimaris]
MGSFRSALRGSLCWLVLCGFASADNVSWDDGGTTTNWSDNDNWSTNASPADHDLSIGDLPEAADVSTFIDSDFNIASLALAAGTDADTSGHLLSIAGTATIDGAGTTLVVSTHNDGANSTSVAAESMLLSGGGTLAIAGGKLVFDDEIDGPPSVASLTNTSGMISGYGIILLHDDLGPTVTTTLVNDGALQSQRPLSAGAGEHFTLVIDSSHVNHRIDLDGANGAGVVNIGEETTLELQAQAATFGGTLNFAAGSLLELDDPFTTNGATVNVDAGATGSATVRGYRIGGDETHTTPTTYNVNSGSFVHEEGFHLNSASVVNLAANTTLVFQNKIPGGGTVSEIEGTLNFDGPGITLLVDETSLALKSPSFDWDGPEDVVTQVQSGNLYVQSDDISPAEDDDSYDGTLNLIDSNFYPETPGGWVFGGTMNLDSSFSFTPNSTIESDETMTVAGGVIHVATGLNALRAPTVFATDASGGTNIEEDATLRVEREVTFQGGSTHSGEGTLEFHAATFTVNGNQALAMSQGLLNLAADPTESETWQLNARLSVQTNEMDKFGNNTDPVEDAIYINGADGQLAVDVFTSNQWTLGEQGAIYVNGTAGFASSLSGDDVLVEGSVVVTDNTEFTARLDVATGGTININTPGAALRLAGGSSATPNSISGGHIQGPGQLRATNSTGLAGYGVINADLIFAGNADLRASGGTLMLGGQVLNADRVIADDGATLQLSQMLDTANLSILDVSGGTIAGAGIVNNNITLGRGEIAVGTFINNGTLHAVGAADETLVVSATEGIDLDGDGASGQVQATSGNLTLASGLTDEFDGNAFVGAGRTLMFQQGWILGAEATLQLTGNETDRATVLSGGDGSELRGTVEVSGLGRLENATFAADANVDVPLASDVLELDGDSTIASGATLAGAGLLQNLSSGTLTLEAGNNIDLDLDSEGQLHLEGHSSVRSFTQTADGTLLVDILNSTDFGQLEFADTAQVAGQLQLAVDDSYVATEGDSFPILTGSDGVTGTFDTLADELPRPGIGLGWELHYTGADVQLRVIAVGLPGDFNDDGTVDLADYTVWRNHLGVADEGLLAGNGDNSGVVDTGDYQVWKTHFGADQPSNVDPEPVQVPEPNTLSLLAILGCRLLFSARVSRKCA